MDLKTLTELRAPSGNEQPLRRALLEEIKGMGLEPKLDRLGNVVAVSYTHLDVYKRQLLCGR